LRASGYTLAIWFVYSLITSAFAGSIPLILKENGASNAEIMLLTVSMASVVNSILNPVISYASDFTRSRFGRRRPYMLWAAPVMGFFFALLGFAGDIADWCGGNTSFAAFAGLFGFSPVTMVFVLITLGYYLSFTFIGTVTFYLIPDIIPKAVISRYYGIMRVSNTAGGAVFSYFMLQYVLDYGRLIMPGIAIVFTAVTMYATWRIKEGDYPPPPTVGGSSGIFSKIFHSIRDYFKSSFADSYCWLVLITFGISGISFCLHSLIVFFCLEEIGMSLEEFGKANAWMSIGVLLVLPLSLVLDRANHFRVFFYSWLGVGIASLLGYFTVVGFWSFFVIQMLIMLAGLPTSIDGIKVSIDLFPVERYGQFCSARAMFNSLCAIVFSLLGGKMLDFLGRYVPKAGEPAGLVYSVFGHYRVLFLWRGVFMVIAAVLFWQLYRTWLKNRRSRNKPPRA
jgi:MFS family permease